MKTWKRNHVAAIIAIFGIVVALSACINAKRKGSDNIDVNVIRVDPADQITPLTGGTLLLSYSHGNKNLPDSPYGYETWDFSGGSASANKFTWYGANQGGGGAYKATWSGYFLARLGFFWGNGGKYTQYNNIYIDYNYNRSDNDSSKGGFIGMYGWSRNASALKDIEKLIEYYIVDGRELAKLGVSCTERPDGLVIHGAGGRSMAEKSRIIDGHGDHRIVMAFAAAALGCQTPIEIETAESAAITYPGFLDLLGAEWL